MSHQLRRALQEKSSHYEDTSLFITDKFSFLKNLQENYDASQTSKHFIIPSFLSPNNEEKYSLGLKNRFCESSRNVSSSHAVISKAKTYLVRKYFEGLYSFQLPLHYFSKSTISKLESAYKIDLASKQPDNSSSCPSINKKHSLIKLLTNCILEIEEFDKRYNDLGNYLKKDIHDTSVPKFAILENPIEKEIFNNFLKKIQFNEITKILKEKDSPVENAASCPLKKQIFEIIDKFLLFLKIRESQLQTILLIEYIYLNTNDIESSSFLTNTERLQLPKKQTLSRSSPAMSPVFPVFANRPIIRPRRHGKNQKHGLQRSISVPNVAKPVVINSESSTQKEKPSFMIPILAKDIYYYKQLLNTYLDRLLIWDALKETKDDVVGLSSLSLLKKSDKSNQADEFDEEFSDIFSIKAVFSNELLIPRKFISKIISPYFYYKCPLLTQFIISKVSGNLRKSIKRSVSSAPFKSSFSSQDSKRIEKSNLYTMDNIGGTFSSPELLINKRRSIRRSKTEASISLISSISSSSSCSDLRNESHKLSAPPSSLSSSSSSSSSGAVLVSESNKISKLLCKREIDFTLPKSTSKLKSLSLSEDILKKPKFISRTQSSLKSTKMKSFSQIDSTPTKVIKNLAIPDTEIAIFKRSLLEQLAEIESLEKSK